MPDILNKVTNAVSKPVTAIESAVGKLNKFKNVALISGFYDLAPALGGKSVLHGFKFLTYFINLNRYKDVAADIGPMPQIMPWHVKSIKIPRYQFKTQTQKFGAMVKGFSTLDYNEPLSIQVEFEEDAYGTIGYLGEWMMQSVINKDGLYRAPDKTKWGNIIVEINDYADVPVQYIIFERCYFQSISELNLDYDNGGSIGYSMNFGCDFMKSVYVKPNLNKIINNLVPFK